MMPMNMPQLTRAAEQLIAPQLPGEVTELARRIERVGLESLLARDLRARLR